ncbi:MAG: hypothetical protein ACLQK4_00115 [Acidimicrobiales bacterium]
MPWTEVRIELPVTVFHRLERLAHEHNVSVESVICAIVARRLADGPGEPK